MATTGRWATFVALAVVLGAFGGRWALRGARERRIATIGLVAALLLIPAALVRLAAQVIDMADPSDLSPDWRALVTAVTSHTHWGHVWIAHVVLAVVAAAGFAVARTGRPAGWVVAGVAAVALAVTLALGGHAAEAMQFRVLVVSADVLHVLGGGVWLGTLGVLAAVGLTGETMDSGDVVETVRRFSPVALGSAAIVAVSGGIAAWSHLEILSAFWTTIYGWTLLVKLAAVALVLAAGAYNWKRVTPRLVAREAAGRTVFARAVATELTLGALVFLVTAILVATPLPGME